MNPRGLIAEIRRQAENVKKAGYPSVTIVSLEALLSLLEKHADDADGISAVRLEEAKLQHASNLAEYAAKSAAGLELFKSVISTAKVLIKSLILINGGAAVALLAFIGHLATNDRSAGRISPFATPLLYFVSGVLSAALFSGFVCLAQKFYSQNWKIAGDVNVWVSVLLGLGSFVAFAVGSYAAYQIFSTM